jgi:hypothetical protein
MDELNKLIGKVCRIETAEGSVRTERVARIGTRKVSLWWPKINGPVVVSIPHSLFYDEGEVDGVELSMVTGIQVMA